MDSTRNASMQSKTSVGGFLGERKKGSSAPGRHAPGIKKNWQDYQAAQDTSKDFNDSYDQAGIAGEYQQRYQASPARKVNVIYNNPEQAAVSGPWGSTRQATRTERFTYQAKKKSAKPAAYLAARMRVSTANAWIGSWAMFWYLTFQMPLAVMSAAGLGMAYAVYTSIVALPGGKFLLVAVEGFADVTGDRIKAILDWAGSLFGITFDPLLLFITPFALVFLLGLFQLIFTWFISSLMRIKSLSGTAGGLKGLMFILAGVGYAIPILNLFPLIFLWMVVVWIHPK